MRRRSSPLARAPVISGWSDKFEDPIELPNGRKLLTLRDAANLYHQAAKGRSHCAEWQAAMEALILVAENGGPTMLPRVGVMRA